jgi:PHP family Zn ribbon phosphoesterase
LNEVADLSFRKVDLHIHTPQSVCYSDPSVTPGQIVQSALAAGLDAIAITDHNTAEGIEGVRQAGNEKGLPVFPGMELSTRGGHVLALFELDTPVEKLRDFLDNIGINREGWGDAATMAAVNTEEVFQRLEDWGGIAIAAHIERWPSGFLKTNESRRVKIKIHNSRYLSALEITVPHDKNLWNNGLVRNYHKKYACIQGSDAHALEEIGRRPVYIRMEDIGLDALRAAFLDFEASIMFPDELPLRG